MKFYSTNNSHHIVDLKTAVIQSLPPDNGLYMPETIPEINPQFINDIDSKSFHEICVEVCSPFLDKDFSRDEIIDLIQSSMTFDAPVIQVKDGLYSLELWHGPSMAFKDFGARFMAALMNRLIKGENKTLDILVATSGDTGGAVAAGFLGYSNIRVTILYPSGKVSQLQEAQLTTHGKNIKALEVMGTFDDCQQLVKKAFLDKSLNQQLHLSSANSINIARLLPQMFYYFEAYKKIKREHPNRNVIFCVPSGNFGNLTAGLLSKRMGLPVFKFIAATNANNIVPRYLSSGEYEPSASIATIANAMDVGKPSNFNRIMDIYGNSRPRLMVDLEGYYFNDIEIRSEIIHLYKNHKYLADPHGACGFLASDQFSKDNEDCVLINLETAHPAKFLDVYTDLNIDVGIPERLKELTKKEKKSIVIQPDYVKLKNYLLNR